MLEKDARKPDNIDPICFYFPECVLIVYITSESTLYLYLIFLFFLLRLKIHIISCLILTHLIYLYINTDLKIQQK